VEHYVRKCRETTEWFAVLGKEKIIKRLYLEKLEGCKSKVLRRLWKKKEIKSKIKNNEEGKDQGYTG